MDFIFKRKQEVLDVWNSSKMVGLVTVEAVGECSVGDVAILASLLILSDQICTLLQAYSSVKVLEPMAAPSCRSPWMVMCTSVWATSFLCIGHVLQVGLGSIGVVTKGGAI